MHVCIILAAADWIPGVERQVFGFTRCLEHYCSAITMCRVTVRGPADNSPEPQAWSVRVESNLFSDKIDVVGVGSTSSGADALTQALHHAFQQARTALDAVAREHRACGCGQDARLCGMKETLPD